MGDFVSIFEVLGLLPISSPVCDWTLRREEGGYGLALLFCGAISGMIARGEANNGRGESLSL